MPLAEIRCGKTCIIFCNQMIGRRCGVREHQIRLSTEKHRVSF
ncbi:Uncharacterised protein [Vibrio cholerae]|nr:Uncharacterised protein [Vibrio cholerae]CSC82170.1 Uncharacterised protein [Vibrio cholerae]